MLASWQFRPTGTLFHRCWLGRPSPGARIPDVPTICNRPTVPLLASLALGAQAIFSAGGGHCFCCALKAAAQTEGRSCSSADSSEALINGRRSKTARR